jgi:hypothetical protein
MIEMPKRSVTRFFIPLVDIMMLLFSMFLLLPMIESSSEGQSGGGLTGPALRQENKTLQEELDHLQKQMAALQDDNLSLRKIADPKLTLDKLQQEIEALRKGNKDVLQKRLFLQVVTFDPKKKDLVYFEKSPTAKEKVIADKEAATALIREHETQAQKDGKDLYYVLMWPSFPQGPTLGQAKMYEDWFGSVPHQALETPK